ncbi:MAG: hypothetical protein ONB23_11035 [candidate division KSB1 bacterium]|nr:hypothetical protein [candidate division KSB1 bacterium]
MTGRFGSFLLVWTMAQLVSIARGQESSQSLLSLLPQVPGWKQSEEPAFYDRSNLFDYIDGGCELYYAHGFQQLASALYESTADPGRTLTVDIYDMGSPLGAFGIYGAMVYPEFPSVPIGCGGVVSDLQLRFWQGRYEVELNGDVDRETLLAFAAAISAKMPPCELPEQVAWIPRELSAPNGLRYAPHGVLQFAFLPPGMEAVCPVDTLVVRAFVARAATADSAMAALSQFRRHVLAETPPARLQDSATGFTAKSPRLGHLMVETCGEWVLGSVCRESAEAAAKVLGQLREHVCNRLRLQSANEKK